MKLEQHYTVKQVADKIGYSVDAVRRMFADDPTVLKLGHQETLHQKKRIKLSIPESTLDKKIAELKRTPK